MSVFTPLELEYLQHQPLMRFATASASGKPDVAPVVFWIEGDDIVTSGFDVLNSVRYKNVLVNPRATVVIDDLASVKPWTPRGIKIIGTVTVEPGRDSMNLRIHPQVIISWGVNDSSPGIPRRERRSVNN